MERIKVKPRNKDLVVLDVNGKLIPYNSKGHPVTDNSFYRRLIRDGDLVKIEKKTTATPEDGEK